MQVMAPTEEEMSFDLCADSDLITPYRVPSRASDVNIYHRRNVMLRKFMSHVVLELARTCLFVCANLSTDVTQFLFTPEDFS